jgi:hypothetical protein
VDAFDRVFSASVEMEAEQWHPITGFAAYSVSDFGRVRNDQSGKVLSPSTANGYKFVGLCNQGVRTNCRVHRLVVQEFVGPIPEGMEVDHIDRNRANNNVSNLRIVSKSENMRNCGKYGKRVAEWLDELPDGAEPLTKTRYYEVADGYYQCGRDYYVKVNSQYMKLARTRNGDWWNITVKRPDGRKTKICWMDEA